MNSLPQRADTATLLRWVADNPNKPFDPTMVVSLSTGHTSDWEWQAVVAQMEDLSKQAYIMRLRQDPSGSTYWTISQKGENYLHALERFQATGSNFANIVDGDEWDVFISHASEDKSEIARPLAEALRDRGLRVWYDEFSLTVGDSLRKKIDQGLANSSFGIVILSPHFFEKHWPEQELNGLATREVGGKKVILPLWHGVVFEHVRKYSPTLADRLAVRTEQGLPHIVEELLKAMGRDIPSNQTPPKGSSQDRDTLAISAGGENRTRAIKSTVPSVYNYFGITDIGVLTFGKKGGCGN